MSDGAGEEPPKDPRQLAYEAERAAHRAAYLAWLAERVLPGTPRTVLHRGRLD